MNLQLKTYSIPVSYKILEDTLNIIMRVFFPFYVGFLTFINPFWVFALLPVVVFNVSFKFQRQVDIKAIEGGI